MAIQHSRLFFLQAAEANALGRFTDEGNVHTVALNTTK
ncbi:hypothetical protein SAMN04489841_1096 [Natrinema salaciae]|uniref:Uncharacterized protein n=1 Tax=Natrinema salaciae TaxID=1186196 RepID=A0A1H9CMD0_9EURY|nr:hypothetical protein SAMN04489841_1096 [Natrinema salaciae]